MDESDILKDNVNCIEFGAGRGSLFVVC